MNKPLGRKMGVSPVGRQTAQSVLRTNWARPFATLRMAEVLLPFFLSFSGISLERAPFRGAALDFAIGVAATQRWA